MKKIQQVFPWSTWTQPKISAPTHQMSKIWCMYCCLASWIRLLPFGLSQATVIILWSVWMVSNPLTFKHVLHFSNVKITLAIVSIECWHPWGQKSMHHHVRKMKCRIQIDIFPISYSDKCSQKKVALTNRNVAFVQCSSQTVGPYATDLYPRAGKGKMTRFK